MANVFDYLDWRGDLPFCCAPCTEVDNLIFSLLSYLDFSGILPGTPPGLPMEEVLPLYLERHPRGGEKLGLLIPNELKDLLEQAAACPRFARVGMWASHTCSDAVRELQFSALTFTLGCGQSFVAFRGTDDTIVGWKEDFNMSYRFPVPAQEEARVYLDRIAPLTGDRLLLGGHSKGGNLAVYAASFCSPQIRDRIDRVWSNDGPGFLPQLFTAPGFLAVRDRVVSILPRSSVVGIMLSLDWETVVIESSALGALQHGGLTWQVMGPSFVRARGLSRGSRHLDKTFHNLLLELDPGQRRRVIDDIFSAGEELGASTLSDLAAEGRRGESLRHISSKLTGLEKSARDSIFRALRSAFRDDGEEGEEFPSP